jgi:ABC-type enterochelin transport system permease subunit
MGIFTILSGVIISELLAIFGLYADFTGIIQLSAIPQVDALIVSGLGLMICLLMMHKVHEAHG